MIPKPPPSAVTGKVPKGTDIDEIKGLDDAKLDYHANLNEEEEGSELSKTQETSKDEKSQDAEKPPDWQCCQSGGGSTEHRCGS